MSKLNIIVPVLVTAVITAIAIFVAVWLTGLVPTGPWADLIKAAIVIFIIGSLILVIGWSAYFTYVIRQSLKKG